MKKQMKLCTLLTKPFVLFVLLFALGVGEMWGNVKHPVYCAISPSSLGDGTLKLKVTKGDTYDGGVEYITEMTKIPTTIHKSETGETKDLYYAIIEYVEDGLKYMSFEIYDGDSWREKHEAFNTWWTSPGYTKPIFDYENGNFTTYPANLAEKTSYVYFNAAEWTDAHDYIQLATGHGLYQGYNQLFKLSNTTIYYGHPTLNWSDAVQIAFLGHHEMFGTGNNWLTDLPANADAYTGFLHYSLQENSYNYFARNTNDAKGTAVSDSYLGTESTDWQKLNKTQTVQARVKATGSSYSDAAYASWPGSVSVARTYMSSATATSTPSAANMTSATTDAILTSSITLTASANSGYYFEGWGDASDANPTDGTAAKIYPITGTKTSYAFFSQAYTLTYDRKGDYNTSTVTVYSVNNFSGSTTSGSSIPTGHMITLVATPATGYEVEGWYSDASCETAYTSGSGGITIEGGGNTFKLASLNANTEVYCKFQPKTYTINLVGMEATTPGTTSVDVTYNASTNMTASDPITKPTKTHYDFGGYWVRNEDTKALVTKLIDEDGKWIADVEGYTGNDGAGNPTWVHDYPISLYAKWTETPYTITPSVSPAGAGSVNTVTDAHLVTPSSDITATPTNTVWVFDHWTCGTNVGIAEGKGTGDNPVTVTASQNSTITANFKHRYNLLGSKYESDKEKASMATGGMPGWTYGSGADFTINSYTADGDNATVDMSYTCTLEAGTYIFEIHDRQKGESLGRKGDGGGVYALTDGSSVQLRGGTDKDQSIFFYPQHAGQYTFRITYMTKDGNYYYPTVTIERPHQVYFGTGYAGIDNLSSVTSGTTGGTLAVTTSAGSLSNEDWVTYGTDVTYTPSAATGYTFEGFYSSNEYSDRFTQDNPWVHYNVTGDDNVYAKFEEKSTSVTLANDGNGHVTIGGNTETSTTCGVTTTRELTAVPNEGYKFSSWTKTSGDDITLSSTSTNPTTLTGLGSGLDEGQTVTANFVERYSIKGTMNGEAWGTTHTLSNIGTNASSKDTCYVTMTLPANTTYEFAIYDEQTGGWYKAGTNAVYNMTYTNHTNWEFGDTKTYDCGITTAGKGTYKFIFNITDTTVTVVYPTSYQVNYGASPSVGGSITVVDDDSQAVPNGGYVRSGGSVTYTAAEASGYTFVGWCNNDSYGDTFTNLNPWTNSSIAATSNAYAKFKSTNFVIYRSGDMSSDPRAAYDDVESYAGGTISETIEFRMQVTHLDQWYSLCLPFNVSAVKVWDEEDGEYYDLVPYYRTEVGAALQGGHYIIRTPNFSSGSSIAIADFGDWRDPTSADGFLPAKDTPYIIQWHMDYFNGKYISFFGATGQTILTSMTASSAPSSDNVVNVCVNDAMTSGTVKNAYMLESDYGQGAWLREEIGTNRTIPPFECYLLASSTTAPRYAVIQRGMTITDTPTGWEQVGTPNRDKTTKVLIDGQLYIIRGDNMYTIQGALVK